MSTHKVDVVQLGQIEKHSNADTLGIINVLGFQCCIKLEHFQPGDLVAYIEPDMVIDVARPEFSFLQDVPGNGVGGDKTKRRITVRRLRGVWSQGLVVAAPEGLDEGDCAMEALGITRYEPPLHMSTFGEAEKGPPGRVDFSYGLENWRRHQDVFQPGEPVIITEKIHGANARFCYQPPQIAGNESTGRMYCGSRTQWKRQRDDILWWQALKQNPWIGEFCQAHPEVTLYGEVFGQVSDLTYGAQKDQLLVRVFDLLVGERWLDCFQIKDHYSDILPYWVPEVFRGAYDPETVAELAEGKTLISGANHVREGVVVQPLCERNHPDINRVKLKIVGNGYLSRKTK